jgi:aspartate/methionine/tyrosine aminotransferase
MDFCERLAEDKRVICTPLSVFYLMPPAQPAGEGKACITHDPCMLVRFTICKSREYILRACEALEHGPAKS